jgi:hypothetical protein
MMAKQIERAEYVVWSYERPVSRKDDTRITCWSYALRSPCGTFFDFEHSASEFGTRERAEETARAAAAKEKRRHEP